MQYDRRFRTLYRILDEHQLDWLGEEVRFFQTNGHADALSNEELATLAELEKARVQTNAYEEFGLPLVQNYIEERPHKPKSFDECLVFLKIRVEDMAFCLSESENLARELGFSGVQLGVDAEANDGQKRLVAQLREIAGLLGAFAAYD